MKDETGQIFSQGVAQPIRSPHRRHPRQFAALVFDTLKIHEPVNVRALGE
jgi:hypothetical protein